MTASAGIDVEVRVVHKPHGQIGVERVEIVLPATWPGGKNSRQIVRIGGRPVPIKSAPSRKFEALVKAMLEAAWARLPRPLWPRSAIRSRLEIDHDARRAMLILEPAGKHPDEALRKANRGRIRDLDNATVLLHDLLQGFVYADDAQIADITKTRRIGGVIG